MNNEDLMYRTIGELKESNRNIAESMKHIRDNLKTLNDHNILHAEKTSLEHSNFLSMILSLKFRHFWLIVSLVLLLLLTVGIKEAAQFIIPV